MKMKIYRPGLMPVLGLAIVLSSLPLSGCRGSNIFTADSSNVSPTVSDIAQNQGSDAFDQYLTELFGQQVTANAIDFHYSLEHPENYGLSIDEISFGDVSLDTADEDLEDTQKALKTLESFDYEALSDEQQLIYDMLEESFEESVDSFDFILYQTVFSPTLGIQAQLPVILSEYTFRVQKDIEDYLLLLQDVPRYFSDLLEIEKAKSEAGLFMADYTADAIISQCETFIANPDENLLIDIFQEKLDSEMPDLSEADKNRYMEENAQAVKEQVIPAYEMVIDTLTQLKGTGTNEGGLVNYDQGTQYYSLLAQSATGTSWSVEDMIDMTDQSLYNDLNTIAALYMDNEELFTQLTQAQPPVTDPEAILNQLQTKITDEFPAPVSSEFTIKYVHPSLEENLSPAFYMIPAVDATDSNTIYINNYYTNEENAMSMYATLAHEGYPGHLYQTTWFNSTDPHPIRRLLSYSGYSEGWATYVEMRSFAWAGLDEDVAAALAANQDFSLGICARADLGVNYEGWNREDAAQYLDQFAMGDEDTVDWLYEAVVAEPANYLSYYIGYKAFETLRNNAETALGGNFDPVEFHRFILTTGPAPFDLIEERMEEWLDSQNENPGLAA